MESPIDNIDVNVLQAAEKGCRESLSIITTAAQDRVFTYLYRMTLDHHLAEDLCQETMVNLVKSIRRLHFDCEEAFWAWLFRTAQGKVQHHRRTQSNQRLNPETYLHKATNTMKEPVMGLFRRETIDTVFNAMHALRDDYRSVIILRCMNEMSYDQIATILGGSQLRNKMLLVRAKRALRRELTKKGLGRSHFLGALLAFASVTSLRSSRAAGASLINTGFLNGSVPATVLSIIATKVGAIAATVMLSLGLLTGAMVSTPSSESKGFIASHQTLDPMSLLQDSNFAYPSSVLATHSPTDYGFMAVNGSQYNASAYPITVECDDILVGSPRNPESRLILPEDHWIEVGFDGPIQDGPGPDFFYTGWYCPVIEIFLTDGQGHLFQLPTPTCTGDCNRFHLVSFDLADITPPFAPTAIRVRGIGNWYRFQGFELMSIRARL